MESVVFVHGLWMLGVDMALLKKRVRECGYKTHQFHYRSVRRSPEQNARKLQQFVQAIEADKIHFVAHSLGGLVVRHLFALYPQQRAGNVITLGTPHRSSYIAKQIMRHAWGQFILGKSVQDGLLGGAPQWHAANKLGVIAGTGRMGIGRLFSGFAENNDGTVALSETETSAMTDYLILNCAHAGFLYNKTVAKQVCAFLKTGRFFSTKKQI